MEVRELAFLDIEDVYQFLYDYYGDDGDSIFNRAIENRDVRFITYGIQETYVLLSDVYDFLYSLDGEDGENALQNIIINDDVDNDGDTHA